MAKKRWRDAFAACETQQRIRPEATDAELNNPHRGWATFQRFTGDPLQCDGAWLDDKGPVTFKKGRPRRMPAAGDLPTTVAYCRWPWSVLEPRKGEIRYDILDRTLETAMNRGQTLQMRTEPFVKADLPDWFLATGAKCAAAGACDGKTLLEPDANDPLYVKHWSDHIRALGKRYDGHPGLESFDVSYAGRFGECGGNASPETAAKLVDAYRAAFTKTTLLSMIGTHGCRYAAGLDSTQFGWRGDGFMDYKNSGRGFVPDRLCWNHMYDAYPVEVVDCGVAETWRVAPVTMEPYATLVHCHENGWDIDWILEHCLKYRPTIFMHKSVPIPKDWVEAVRAFVWKLGYRFYLHQMTLPLEARPGQKITTTVTIDNKGVAPIYRPYTFALRFSQGAQHAIVPFRQDIRTWMPDYSSFHETFTLPRTLRCGEAKVSCSIIADGQPVVRLAIKDVTKDGWHPLTSLDVL
jgi:hypothetical protein